MDLGVNTETVGGLGGTAGILSFLKLFYNDWCARMDKRDTYKRLDKQDEEIAMHATHDAETFATKNDQKYLFEHVDRKLDRIQNILLELAKQPPNGRDK